jgi:hypothetical protein
VNQDEKNLKILELIAEIRKLEIGLFWSRSLFFWGFTTIAITAYGAAFHFATKEVATKEVQFAIACAGLICSVVWTLVNRSSKYWQRTWEDKAGEASREAVGSNLFAEHPRRGSAGQRFPWWTAHFSVSKLATAFSDFTCFVWISLGLQASPVGILVPPRCVIPVVAACTAIYVGYIFVFCRPDPPNDSN